MSRKVFTAGEVLAAADVNSFLMDQSVMSFAGTAARGSAIPSPVEGMYTHLEDTDDLQFWNGSAWRSPFGLTRLVNQTITSSTGFIIDNVFTTQFDNYKMILKGDSASASTTVGISMQFRKAGSTITASNYRQAGFFFEATGSTSGGYQSSNGGSSVTAMIVGAGGPTSSYSSVEFFNPAVSGSQTGWTNTGFHQYGGASAAAANKIGYFTNGAYTVNDNFDGIILTPASGNFSGSIQIYGYRN
jgi:hypothetical protein